jgi:hypothetical protein
MKEENVEGDRRENEGCTEEMETGRKEDKRRGKI